MHAGRAYKFVCHYDPMMLQSIRLALVMQLADCISAGIGLVENFCLDAASV